MKTEFSCCVGSNGRLKSGQIISTTLNAKIAKVGKLRPILEISNFFADPWFCRLRNVKNPDIMNIIVIPYQLGSYPNIRKTSASCGPLGIVEVYPKAMSVITNMRAGPSHVKCAELSPIICSGVP